MQKIHIIHLLVGDSYFPTQEQGKKEVEVQIMRLSMFTSHLSSALCKGKISGREFPGHTFIVLQEYKNVCTWLFYHPFLFLRCTFYFAHLFTVQYLFIYMHALDGHDFYTNLASYFSHFFEFYLLDLILRFQQHLNIQLLMNYRYYLSLLTI